MRDIIIDLQKSGARKVQLTIAVNCISSKYFDEKRIVHLKCDNKEFKTYGKCKCFQCAVTVALNMGILNDIQEEFQIINYL